MPGLQRPCHWPFALTNTMLEGCRKGLWSTANFPLFMCHVVVPRSCDDFKSTIGGERLLVSGNKTFLANWADSSKELFWSPVIRSLYVSTSDRLSVNCSHLHLNIHYQVSKSQPNLAQSISGWRRFKFLQIKDHANFQGGWGW